MASQISGLEAWNISSADIDPPRMSLVEKLKFAVRCAVLAPSGHNTQPWKFKIKTSSDGTADIIELHEDNSKILAVVDPKKREMTISCGAALFNLRLALKRLGLASDATQVEYEDNKNTSLLAIVHIEKQEAETSHGAETAKLFDQIALRHTDRSPFDTTKPIDDDLLIKLQDIVKVEGAGLLWMEAVVDPLHKSQIATLIAKGDKIQYADKHFRAELSRWTCSNHSTRKDGIPGYALGVGDWASSMAPWIVRTFDIGNKTAAADQTLASESPALLVFGSTTDSSISWIKTGEALQHVLLELTRLGIRASFLNQPIEVEELRPQVAMDVMHVHEYPQLVLRIGFPKNPAETMPTPRHAFDDVIL